MRVRLAIILVFIHTACFAQDRQADNMDIWDSLRLRHQEFHRLHYESFEYDKMGRIHFILIPGPIGLVGWNTFTIMMERFREKQ